jgi:hypothetical protein
MIPLESQKAIPALDRHPIHHINKLPRTRLANRLGLVQSHFVGQADYSVFNPANLGESSGLKGCLQDGHYFLMVTT